ncbi:hypothetical protein F2Q68_00026941 [Brassica cretica]|uniref:Phorbol-ester/DAG-type domain-containing protein n=1 Tax=Brassica cretica TaxID=69181 RepID=A0A8S9IKT5_BRACR|nr:hypothetical protein F2Q68_00026941 [Brassica cretica]
MVLVEELSYVPTSHGEDDDVSSYDDDDDSLTPSIVFDQIMGPTVMLASHEHPFYIHGSSNGHCDGCPERRDNGLFGYSCPTCDLTVHKECAESSPEINHPSHQRHPLTLFKHGLPLAAADDNIDLYCARNPLELVVHYPKGHEHILTLMPRLIRFTCNACGLESDRSPYVCPQCDFMIHEDYYAVHSKCATRSDVWDGRELEDEPEENDECEEPFWVVTDGVINHFSHREHDLRLEDGLANIHGEHTRCKACVRPVYSNSFYSFMDIPSTRGVFLCSACDRLCSGFRWAESWRIGPRHKSCGGPDGVWLSECWSPAHGCPLSMNFARRLVTALNAVRRLILPVKLGTRPLMGLSNARDLSLSTNRSRLQEGIKQRLLLEIWKPKELPSIECSTKEPPGKAKSPPPLASVKSPICVPGEELTTISHPRPTDLEDSYCWKVDGLDTNGYSSSRTWEAIRHRDSRKQWASTVWYKGAIPKHSFNMCFTRHLWGLVFSRLSPRQPAFFTWAELLSWCRVQTRTAPATLRKMVTHVLIYHTWKQRNNAIHNNTQLSPDLTFRLLDRDVRNTITARPSKRNFSNLMELWIR